jgi:hypothetical protein
MEGGFEWYISVWIEVLNASTRHVKDFHILSQQQIVIFGVVKNNLITLTLCSPMNGCPPGPRCS